MILCLDYSLKFRYEFKNNHEEWVRKVNPDLAPDIKESVAKALETTGENIDLCFSIKKELCDALGALLGVTFSSLPQFNGHLI